MPWEAIATIAAVLLTGFGYWMFRIDRGVVELKHLCHRVNALEKKSDRHDQKLERYGVQIARLQACSPKPEA
jgi:hypothetical protein